MPKEFTRTERLAELMRRELAILIQQEVKDPRLGMVTVSTVEITKDLSYAKVYVTSLGDEATISKNLEILKHAAGFLRVKLSRLIKVRKIPELNFIYDKSITEGQRLSSLIDEAIAEDEFKSGDKEKDE